MADMWRIGKRPCGLASTRRLRPDHVPASRTSWCPLCERVLGGDDHGIGAGPALQRRRSVIAEDPGGAAVGGQVSPKVASSAWTHRWGLPLKVTVTVWSMTNGSVPDMARKCHPIGTHSPIASLPAWPLPHQTSSGSAGA